METISLTPIPEQETVSLDSGDSAPILNPQEAKKRAFKASFAFENKSEEEIEQKLLAGEEHILRSIAAAEVDARKSKMINKAIEDLVKRKGSALTPQEYSFIMSELERANQPTNPDDVWEDEYSKWSSKEMDRTAIDLPDNAWEDAKKEIPEYAASAEYLMLEINRKREYLDKTIEKAKSVYDEQTWLGWGVDLAKYIIPFYGDWIARGNVSGAGTFEGGLLGSNTEAQMQRLWALPMEQFKAEVDRIYNDLTQRNPGAALAFLTSMKGLSSKDVFLGNFFTLLDASLAPGYLKSIRGIGSKAVAEQQVKNASKNFIKAMETAESSKAGVSAAAGNIQEAAVQKTIESVKKEYKGLATPTLDAIEALPTHLRTFMKDIKDNPSRLYKELTNRITESMETGANRFLYTLANMNRPDRVPMLEGIAKEQIKQMLSEKYPRMTSMIMDVSAPIKEPLTGVRYVYMDLMRADGKLWAKESTAKNAIAHIGFPKAIIENQGAGFYIRVPVPVDESHPIITQLLVQSPENQLPRSWSTGLLDRIRTPEDTMSIENRRNRLAATYGPQAIFSIMDGYAKKIRDLSRGVIRTDPVTGEKISFPVRAAKAWAGVLTRENKKAYNEWLRMVNAEKEMIDEVTKIPGRNFKSAYEIEDFYLTHFKRMPRPDEIEAYFAHVMLKEMDAIMREIALYGNKTRKGAQLHTFQVVNFENKTVVAPSIEGIRRGHLPGGAEGDVYLVVGKTLENMHLYRGSGTGQMSSQLKKRLDKEVREGKKIVIEIYDPESRPLSGFGPITDANRIRYVILDSVKTEPLSWNQLPRRGGGHFDYDYDFYIKQAKVRKDNTNGNFRYWYEGDSTIMPMMSRAQAKEIASHLDRVRIFLKNKDKVAAKEYAEKHLPIPYEEIAKWFRPIVRPGETKKYPRLSLDEPIQVVDKNRMIVDMDNSLAQRYKDKKGRSLFHDGTKEGSAARSASVEYTGQRDAYELHTIYDKGSRNNPLFVLDKAQMVDPIPSLDRALNRIVNSTFLNDYKIFSVNTWLQHASKYLDVKPGMIDSAPFYVYHNPKWLSGTPVEIRNQLENQKIQIDQLLGVPSKYDTFLHSAASRLSDWTYETFGPKAHRGPLDPAWLLPKLTNPWGFLRSMTFHAALGLFSIPQLLVQSQTYAAIYAIAGAKHAAQGTAGALLTIYSKVNRNPDILKSLDNLATKMGWKKGEFLESLEQMELSGFGKVAGEHSFVDAVMSPNIFYNRGKQFLDAGKIFFTLGEKNVRYGAWHTAYREFRATKKPTGALTDKDRLEILQRADMLNMNMSRASSSLLHTGIMSFPGQFLSYQMRLAELFLGKRLADTRPDRVKARARLAMWYAGLYGLPSTIALTGLPLSDSIRKAALENGYTHGEDHIKSLVMEGVPSYMLAFITGGGDVRNGNWYNINERLGIQGLENINEALRGDKPWWELVGGAALSKMKGTLEGSDGFMTAMSSWIRGDGEKFPLKWDDFIAPFKEISSVNSAERFRMAINTKRWMSKKDSYLGDVSTSNAIFQTLTGLQSQNIADMYLMNITIKDIQEDQKKGLQKFIKEFRKGMFAMQDDPQQAHEYQKRAFAYLVAYGYPEDKYAGAIALAVEGHEPLTNHVNWKFYIENARPGKLLENMETLRTRTNIERKSQ